MRNTYLIQAMIRSLETQNFGCNLFDCDSIRNHVRVLAYSGSDTIVFWWPSLRQ